MGKVWSYDKACELAGDLYGNILARDSDLAGYQAAVEALSDGSASVKEMVLKFFVSEEFREKFVMNQTPNELARRVLIRLARERRPAAEQVKELAVHLLERDWRDVISDFIEGPQYSKAFGEDNVPLWA